MVSRGGFPSGCSLLMVVFSQGGLSQGWSLVRVVSHGGLPAGYSLIMVVFTQGGLSWSFIMVALVRVVSRDGLPSWWSLVRVVSMIFCKDVFSQSGLS